MRDAMCIMELKQTYRSSLRSESLLREGVRESEWKQIERPKTARLLDTMYAVSCKGKR